MLFWWKRNHFRHWRFKHKNCGNGSYEGDSWWCCRVWCHALIADLQLPRKSYCYMCRKCCRRKGILPSDDYMNTEIIDTDADTFVLADGISIRCTINQNILSISHLPVAVLVHWVECALCLPIMKLLSKTTR
jgi:hypothetical protein